MKGEKNEEPMERNEKKEVDKEGEDDKKEIPEIEIMEDDEPEYDNEKKESKKEEYKQEPKPVQRPIMVVRPVRISTRENPVMETLWEETNPEPGEEEDEEEFL